VKTLHQATTASKCDVCNGPLAHLGTYQGEEWGRCVCCGHDQETGGAPSGDRHGVELITVSLSGGRRVLVHPEGGFGQQRHVRGIGWTDADDELWDDAIPAAHYAGALVQFAAARLVALD
jgi:hypothetical protein